MIDVTRDVERNPDFLLTVDRLKAWEREHERVPRGAWVFLRTGWSKRTDATAFLNVGADGPHHPGFDETSRVSGADRDARVGVETVGYDAGQGFTFNRRFQSRDHARRVFARKPVQS